MLFSKVQFIPINESNYTIDKISYKIIVNEISYTLDSFKPIIYAPTNVPINILIEIFVNNKKQVIHDVLIINNQNYLSKIDYPFNIYNDVLNYESADSEYSYDSVDSFS